MAFTRRQLLAASPLALAASSIPAVHLWGADDENRFQELTPTSEESAARGINWLMKTMHRDGGCGVDIGQTPDIGCTAMVGLRPDGARQHAGRRPESREVRNIVNYLLKCIDHMPNDDITGAADATAKQNRPPRPHFFRHAVSQPSDGRRLGLGRDSPEAEEARSTICRMQNAEGHWGGNSWAPMLGTVMGWCCLRGAHYAGFAVAANANKTGEYIIKSMQQNLNNGGGGSWMHTLYKNATGIRVLYAMGGDEEIAKKAFQDAEDLVKKDNTAFSQAGGEEYLAFHLITETMLQKGGDDWKRWFPTCRDKICDVQNHDGSWTGITASPAAPSAPPPRCWCSVRRIVTCRFRSSDRSLLFVSYWRNSSRRCSRPILLSRLAVSRSSRQCLRCANQ